MPTDGASPFPFVRGGFSPESHASARQRFVCARSVRQADELLLRASADTYRMTTSPNGSFSSTQLFRASDTGQAFAPADPSPSYFKYRFDRMSFANPKLDRHFAEAGGSLRPGWPREMSLSCTMVTTRDDESLMTRVVPVLRNTLDSESKGPARRPSPSAFSASGSSRNPQYHCMITFGYR